MAAWYRSSSAAKPVHRTSPDFIGRYRPWVEPHLRDTEDKGSLVSPSRDVFRLVTRVVTKSLYAEPRSSCGRDALASIVLGMDIVYIVLGIVMFLILLLMIEGIDRV